MSNRVSVVSFRAIVPALTVPEIPIEVQLKPICPAMVELKLWCTTTPAFATSGFRVLTRKTQIIPDTGSDEAGLTAVAYAADWAPLPGFFPTGIKLYDKVIDGPPFAVTLQFYSTAAIEVGGLLTTRDPQFGIHDLVLHVAGFMTRIEALNTKKE